MLSKRTRTVFFKIQNKLALFCIPWAVVLCYGADLGGVHGAWHGSRGINWMHSNCKDRTVWTEQCRAPGPQGRQPVPFGGQRKGIEDKMWQSAAAWAIKQSREKRPLVTSLFIPKAVFLRLWSMGLWWSIKHPVVAHETIVNPPSSPPTATEASTQTKWEKIKATVDYLSNFSLLFIWFDIWKVYKLAFGLLFFFWKKVNLWAWEV